MIFKLNQVLVNFNYMFIAKKEFPSAVRNSFLLLLLRKFFNLKHASARCLFYRQFVMWGRV